MLFSDDNISREEKMAGIFRLAFIDMPEKEDIDAAYEFILWFYLCGKAPLGGGGDGSCSVKAFSYDYDDGYIYASFLAQYRIDLRTAELHWWEFKALFRSLEQDRRFSEIMGFRTMEISTKMSPEMQSYYLRMKEHYAIPISEEEQVELDGLTDALLNGGDISKFL